MSCSAWRWYFTYNRVLHLKNTLCTLSKGLGISCNACFYLQYLARCLNYGALLDLPSCKSESWRRYTCTNVLLVCEGGIGELGEVGNWGLEVCFVGLALGRYYVWCLVIVVIFMRFGQAGAKRCGGYLKVINCRWQKSQKGDSFHREGRFSLCNIAISWNFIASLTGYIL